MMKRKLLSTLVATAFGLSAGAANAQISDGVIKIGVMNDMSGLYADIAGPGSVTAAKLAVEDFQKMSKAGLKMRRSTCSIRRRRSMMPVVSRLYWRASLPNWPSRSHRRSQFPRSESVPVSGATDRSL